LNFIDFRHELHRNNNPFVLQCFDAAYNLSIKVQKIKFFVRKIEILDSLGLAIESVLKTTPVKYPIRRIKMTNLHVSNPA